MDMTFANERVTLEEYLSGKETNKRRELTFGVLREPPAPAWDHQAIVGRLFVRLEDHVNRFKLGKVGLSPIDVILDPAQNLVVQPDLVFVSAERSEIIRDRIWGPPDLAVEVLSPDSGRYDREQKREWYQRYLVKELWLVDPYARTIAVCDLMQASAEPVIFAGERILHSRVLPQLRLRVSSVFRHQAE